MAKRKQIACMDCGVATSGASFCDACCRKFMEWAARVEKRIGARSKDDGKDTE